MMNLFLHKDIKHLVTRLFYILKAILLLFTLFLPLLSAFQFLVFSEFLRHLASKRQSACCHFKKTERNECRFS